MVSIICCTKRPSFMENIFSNYKRQVLERKEVNEYKNVVVYQVIEAVDTLNNSVSKDNYVCVRREDLSTHLQKTDSKLYMSRCKFICRTNDYIPKITRKFKPEVKSE